MSKVPPINISETLSLANLLSTHICKPDIQTNIMANDAAAIDSEEQAIE